MAVHIPEQQDIFLNERIEIFRRQADPSAEYQEFLEDNRVNLMKLRREELAHGSQGAARRKQSGKLSAVREGSSRMGSKAGDKAQGSLPGDAAAASGTKQHSGLLVKQRLYDL
jgi:hypothetical protein